MKYILFIIYRQFFYANLARIFLISYVPREKPIKFKKWPLKFFIINSAKYSPVFIADLKAGLNGFDLYFLYISRMTAIALKYGPPSDPSNPIFRLA